MQKNFFAIQTENFYIASPNITIVRFICQVFCNEKIDNSRPTIYNIFITFVRFKEESAMGNLPQISEAEYEVMKIVWKCAPISTNEITEKLTKTTDWSPKTIQTLIKRLVNKGALTYEKQSRMFVYTPLVKEKEYIGKESNSFLKRYYNGDITAMLSAYLENDQLSESEIDSLRSLLSEKKPHDNTGQTSDAEMDKGGNGYG